MHEVYHKFTICPILCVRISKTAPAKRVQTMVGLILALDEKERGVLIGHYLARPMTPVEVTEACQSTIRAAIVEILLADNRRNDLIALLSNNAVRTIGTTPPELYCVLRAPPDMRDPIMILVDAYDCATDGDSKDILRDRLVAAFPDIGRELADSGRRVKAIAEWYRARRNELQINDEYKYHNARPEQPVALFVPR